MSTLNLDLSFVSAVLAGDKATLRSVIDRGVKPEFLMGDGAVLYDFVLTYFKEHGTLPSLGVVEAKFGVVLLPPEAAATFLAQEVLDRKLYQDLTPKVVAWASMLSDNKPRDALTAINAEMRRVRAEQPTGRVERVTALGSELREDYERMKAGEWGLPLPWPTINEATLGLWPEDLVIAVARTGVGKCISGDALVQDPVTGVLRPLRERVAASGSVLSYSHELSVRRVDQVHCNGEQACVRMRLSSGRTLVLTASHPLLTPQGWREVRELRIGSDVAIPATAPHPEQPADVSASEVRALADRVRAQRMSARTLSRLPDEAFRLSCRRSALLLGRLFRGEEVLGFASERAALDVQHLLSRHGRRSRVRVSVGEHGLCWEVCRERRRVSRAAVVFDTVADVRPAGVHTVYDLGVAGTHNYVVADVLVHNSWAGIMVAEYLWKQKKKVLFVTTELSRISVARRFFSLYLRVPYTPLRRGKLDAFAEKKFYDAVDALSEEGGFYIVGGDFNFTFDALEGAIEESEPHAVIVDGAYLLKAEGNNRTERAAAAFDELKRTGKRNKLPMVATSQFNRDSKNDKADAMALDKIALTDAASWNADVVLGLNRTEDQRRDNKLEMKLLKNREGILGDPVVVHWDFEGMRFHEVPKEGGGDADEYGTGFDGTKPVLDTSFDPVGLEAGSSGTSASSEDTKNPFSF